MGLPKGAHNLVYPQPLTGPGQPDQRPATQRGISLLDHLAIAALPLAEARASSLRAGYANGPAIREHAEAYNIAEAMLTERQKRFSAAEAAPAA